jgi:putative peptidoglycan lipid II flippase
LIFLSKLVLAVSLMAVVLHFAAGDDFRWLSYNVWMKMGHLMMLLLLGVAVYFSLLWLMGLRIQDFIRRSKI